MKKRNPIPKDDRHCPSCGHEVLNWDISCPGCDQIPWNSDAGRRIIRRRRLWYMVITGGPIAALLVLVLAVVIIGNSGFTRTMKQVKEAGRLAQIVEEAKFLSARFERVRPGSTTYEDVIAATQRWHAQSLHELLDMAKDSRLSPTTRSDAIRNVGRLLETSSQFAKVVPKSRNKAIEALLPLLNQPIESLRNEALGALRALGVDDEWLILEHTDARSAQKEKR